VKLKLIFEELNIEFERILEEFDVYIELIFDELNVRLERIFEEFDVYIELLFEELNVRLERIFDVVSNTFETTKILEKFKLFILISLVLIEFKY
jgi:hypothetical protein